MLSDIPINRISVKLRVQQPGFSLIELLVVMAIIGILATVAYPSYTSYAMKTNRSDGMLALMASVQAMERCRSTTFTYAGCELPAAQTTSPEGYYSIALTPAPTAATYTIVATPQGSQTSDTECRTMSIDQTGARSSTPSTVGADDNGCWPMKTGSAGTGGGTTTGSGTTGGGTTTGGGSGGGTTGSGGTSGGTTGSSSGGGIAIGD